jgi:nicotinate-nucleotide--dimethylbenzimidazole phosphoribosyltransferase
VSLTEGGHYARPVPLIGDRTSARERAHRPHEWAFPEADRQALYRVIAARRDVRRFRADPIPDDVLERVLGAAHAAPSVGHSQPWRFVVVTEAATREQAALMADRARLAQAAGMDPGSARALLDLQLEGLREAPVGVVVCCDRRVPAAGVLGRATFPDTDVWSCACAIENLWLAARAEGLGLGWVTLFEPAELAELIALPAGVVTLGWLCLGWPDERPPAPGLERAGWSRRLPLDDVIVDQRWPATAEPAAPRSRLRAPDQRTVVAVRDGADELLTPPGSLGIVDRALDRIAALGGVGLEGGTLTLVAADHPVAGLGVSAYPAATTAEVLTAALADEAVGVVAARAAGLRTVVVDAGVGPRAQAGAVPMRPQDPRGDLVDADALSRRDAADLVASGRELGREVAAHGTVVLGEIGIGNTTVAAALTAALLGMSAEEAVGVGAGADSDMVGRKARVVDAALRRAHEQHGTALADTVTLLAALGGPEAAVLSGVVLGAAEAGEAVVLDGLLTSVAALMAVRTEPAVAAHLVAGHRSRERAHTAVLRQLGLEPLIDGRIRAGEGVGACLAVTLLRSAMLIRSASARTTPADR